MSAATRLISICKLQCWHCSILALFGRRTVVRKASQRPDEMGWQQTLRFER